MYTATEMNLAVKAQINHLHKAAEDLEKRIKSFMERKGIDTMTVGDHAVTYKAVETAQLDTTALKKDFDADMLDKYMIRSTTKRISVK